jgi:plastocyanin
MSHIEPKPPDFPARLNGGGRGAVSEARELDRGSLMKSWMVRVLVAGVLASLLAVGGPAAGGSVKIKAKGTPGNFSFSPTFPHVEKGSKVVWKNTTPYLHRLAFYKGKWEGKSFDLPANGSFSKKPKRTGQYFYRCSIPGHSTLTGDNCSGMCGAFHVAKS